MSPADPKDRGLLVLEWLFPAKKCQLYIKITYFNCQKNMTSITIVTDGYQTLWLVCSRFDAITAAITFKVYNDWWTVEDLHTDLSYTTDDIRYRNMCTSDR